MQNWITDLEKNEGAATMLKACWLVYPCSSVPTLFPLFSVCVGLLRSALCLRPFLSIGFSFSILSSVLQILALKQAKEMALQLLHTAGGYWLRGKKNNGHAGFDLFFLASSCFLLFSFPPSLFCFPFPFSLFTVNEQKLLMFSAFYLYSLYSLFIFSTAPSFPSPIACLSVEMMREMAMKACYAGWVHAPASVFFFAFDSVVLLSFFLSFLSFPSSLLLGQQRQRIYSLYTTLVRKDSMH